MGPKDPYLVILARLVIDPIGPYIFVYVYGYSISSLSKGFVGHGYITSGKNTDKWLAKLMDLVSLFQIYSCATWTVARKTQWLNLIGSGKTRDPKTNPTIWQEGQEWRNGWLWPPNTKKNSIQTPWTYFITPSWIKSIWIKIRIRVKWKKLDDLGGIRCLASM